LAAPTIVEVNPAPSGTSIALADRIFVVFDQEVDPETVQIIVEGPDTDRWSGPDQARIDDTNTDADDDILATPGYKGVLGGTLSFEKVDSEGNSVSAYDYSGLGDIWYTKAIFTPTYQLVANTEFRVYIMGSEESAEGVDCGVSSRTVYDTAKGANLGTGSVSFSGGYTGTASDVINVRVVRAGNAEDKLRFQYWRTGAPTVVRELTTRLSSQLLFEGISVRFTGDFEINDTFTCVIEPAVRMADTYTWVFTTGSGSIITVSEDLAHAPSVPIGGFTPVSGSVNLSSAGLQILSVTPEHRSTNLAPTSVEAIVIVFNKALDAETITDDSIEVWSEPVNGEFTGNDIQFSGELAKILSVNGSILTIQIA